MRCERWNQVDVFAGDGIKTCLFSLSKSFPPMESRKRAQRINQNKTENFYLRV
jgi:hypothetical protein